jgi:hypothetical protein
MIDLEQAVLRRPITDIYADGYYYHFVGKEALVEAPSWMVERACWAEIPNRVENTLKYGILAAKMAKKLGVPYYRNYDPKVLRHDIHWYDKDEWVYLFEEQQQTSRKKDIVSTRWYHPVEETLFIIDKSLKVKTHDDMIKSVDATWVKRAPEVYRHLRVPPKFFVGVGIDDYMIRDESHLNQLAIERAAQSAHLEPNGEITTLPIYGLTGNLYYPNFQTYEELKQTV